MRPCHRRNLDFMTVVSAVAMNRYRLCVTILFQLRRRGAVAAAEEEEEEKKKTVVLVANATGNPRIIATWPIIGQSNYS